MLLLLPGFLFVKLQSLHYSLCLQTNGTAARSSVTDIKTLFTESEELQVKQLSRAPALYLNVLQHMLIISQLTALTVSTVFFPAGAASP